MDGAPNARIGSAPADVAGHGLINIFVGWFGVFFEENGRAHDLSRLAVATLRDIHFNPGALQRMGKVVRKAFNRSHVFAGNSRQWGHARANGATVEMHRARTA